MTAALPSLSAAEAGHLNMLAGRDGALAVPFIGGTWWLRLRSGLADGDAAALLADPYHLHLELGGCRIELAVEATVFREMLSGLIPGTDPGHLPEPLLLALAELAAEDVAGTLESAFGHAVRLVGVGAGRPAASGQHRLGITLRREDGVVVEAVLGFDARGLALLAGIAERLPEPPADDDAGRWDGLPVPLRLDVGWADLALAELSALAGGDIVLLDHATLLDGDRLIVRLGPATALRARLDGATLCFEEIIGRTTMSEDPATAPAEQPGTGEAGEPLLASLDQVEIRLTFDVGQQVLTLADLRRLKPGMSFDLGRDPQHAVNIRANGRLVGTGALVRIDDRIGVRVVSLSGAAE